MTDSAALFSDGSPVLPNIRGAGTPARDNPFFIPLLFPMDVYSFHPCYIIITHSLRTSFVSTAFLESDVLSANHRTAWPGTEFPADKNCRESAAPIKKIRSFITGLNVKIGEVERIYC